MNLDVELSALLHPQLREVVAAIANAEAFLIEIPTGEYTDLSIEELRSLVARTSNAYGRVARFAGIARAEAKLAKGRYDRTFKQSRAGRNEAERDARGLAAAETEHVALIAAEAVAEVADALESGARVASESARKLLGAVTTQLTAARREDHGALVDHDFRPY